MGAGPLDKRPTMVVDVGQHIGLVVLVVNGLLEKIIDILPYLPGFLFRLL